MLMNELDPGITYVYEHIDESGRTKYFGCGTGARCLSTASRDESHRKYMIEAAETMGDSFVRILFASHDQQEALEREYEYTLAHYEVYGRRPVFNYRMGRGAKPRGKNSRGCRKVNKWEVEEMRYLQQHEGMTYEQIGNAVGRHRTTVWWHLNPRRARH